jgi:hypothetical protein
MSFETVSFKNLLFCFNYLRLKTTGFENLRSIILFGHNSPQQTFEINENKFLVKENPGIGFI